MRLSEAKVNEIVAKNLTNHRLKVIRNQRINPAELDLVVFDKISLALINIEIKRNNWKKLFQQTLRGQLYCHYSIALAPIQAKGKIDSAIFASHGLGLMYYIENKHDKISLEIDIQPQKSNIINRNFKKILYKKLN